MTTVIGSEEDTTEETQLNLFKQSIASFMEEETLTSDILLITKDFNFQKDKGVPY